MFFLPKHHSQLLRKDNPADWVFISKIVTVILVATSAAAALIWGLKDPVTYTKTPNKPEIVVLNFMNFFECLYFGMSVAFVVFLGAAVAQVSPKVRRKIVAIYLCISWIMVSWFPHVTLHKFYRDIWGSIALDISFHLTVVAASIFLTYYICILMKSAANSKTDKSSLECSTIFSRKFYKSDLLHVIAIAISIGIVFFFIGRLLPLRIKANNAQKIFLGILSFAESCLLGCSVKIIPIIRRIDDVVVKRKAVLITICITWLLASWWPHMKMHLTSKSEDGKIILSQWIILSICFHWTVMFCSALISYVLYGVIQLAVDYSKSPFRKTQENVKANTTSNSLASSSEPNTILPSINSV